MIRAIVTDIEGTTSSISFVHEVLFPYARQHMEAFVRSHANDAQLASLLDDVRREASRDLDLDGIISQLHTWIDEDRKITPLKTLQGMIWEAGYRDGNLRGHIYPDAHEYLNQWHEQGIRLYVYSSGSVKAQQLLFAHTEYGDLTPLFDGYFDTHIGAKREVIAYQRITEELALPSNEILFLSDIETELDAAQQTGMHTVWLVREQEPTQLPTHRQVSDFAEVDRWLRDL